MRVRVSRPPASRSVVRPSVTRSPSATRRVAIAVALVASAAGLGLLPAGAGAAGTLNTSEVESTIRRQFADQGVRLRRVSCRSVRAQVGARISCTALNPSDTKLVLRGKVTSLSGDSAGFSVKAVYGFAKGSVIAKQVRTLLERRAGERARRVTCPQRVRIPTTRTVTCALTTRQGQVFDVRVRIDAKSRISARVADRPR